jgi:hypothetical protein
LNGCSAEGNGAFWRLVGVLVGRFCQVVDTVKLHTYIYIHTYIYLQFLCKDSSNNVYIYIYTYNTFKFLAYNSAGLTQAPSLNPKWDLKARNEGFYWMYYQAWSGVMTCYDSAFGWTYGDELFGMILILW